MTLAVSSSPIRLNAAPVPVQNEKFTPLPNLPVKIAQFDMPDILEPIKRPISEAATACIAAALALVILGGKNAFSTLQYALNQAGIKYTETVNSSKEAVCKNFAIWLTKTGTAKASNGNPKLKAVFDQFLARADVKNILAQAGINSNVMPSNAGTTEERLKKIYKVQEQAKYNTGLGNGFSCNTEVNIGRMNGVSTITNAKTTATDGKGNLVGVPVEQYLYTYSPVGILIEPRSAIGAGTVADKTVTPSSPIVVVTGFCGNIPSSVRTIDRPYTR
jgi:hypothetical protein